MLNLAPLKYPRALASRGGPIEKILYSELEIEGSHYYQSTAYLAPEFVKIEKQDLIYGMADGCGTDKIESVARYKSVSEALERWAFFECAESQTLKYGFDIDPSTNGMSAFSGLFGWQSRGAALCEAVERRLLVLWWENKISSLLKNSFHENINCLELFDPASGISVALLWKQISASLYTYGFAGHTSFKNAYFKALIELNRNEVQLTRFFEKNQGKALELLNDEIREPFEKRLLYFSQSEAHKNFLERVQSSASMKMTTPADPKIVFDGEIPGPWSSYAHVWRVAYEPASQDYLSDKLDYFYF